MPANPKSSPKVSGGIAAGLQAAERIEDIMAVVRMVGNDPARFAELTELFLGPPGKVSTRVSNAFGHAAEAHPRLVIPHLGALLKNMELSGHSDAVVRTTLRTLQFVDVPARYQSMAFNVALGALTGPVPVAMKVFAMTVLKRLATTFPELMPEVRRLVEEQLPHQSLAFRTRARMEFGIGAAESC